MTRKTISIWITLFDHKHGSDVEAYATSEEAEAAKLNIAERDWEDRADCDAPEDPRAAGWTDDQILAAYWDDHDREFFTIQESRIEIDVPTPTVKIRVEGGMIQDVEIEDGIVDVQVRDYDTEGTSDPDTLKTDSDGKDYIAMNFGNVPA